MIDGFSGQRLGDTHAGWVDCDSLSLRRTACRQFIKEGFHPAIDIKMIRPCRFKRVSMKRMLEIIDGAVKRLVTPVAMLVAAGMLSNGLEKQDASQFVVIILMALLVLWALGYTAVSVAVAIGEFEREGISKTMSVMLGTSFILVYLVLFVVALKFGFERF
ncbi:MAG: hypothetical protein ACKVLM_00980 [Pseudomonadales bacterium]